MKKLLAWWNQWRGIEDASPKQKMPSLGEAMEAWLRDPAADAGIRRYYDEHGRLMRVEHRPLAIFSTATGVSA